MRPERTATLAPPRGQGAAEPEPHSVWETPAPAGLKQLPEAGPQPPHRNACWGGEELSGGSVPQQ